MHGIRGGITGGGRRCRELLRLQAIGPAGDLFAELEAAHHRLRDLFALGEDEAVHTLPLSVLVLAARTEEASRGQQIDLANDQADAQFPPVGSPVRRRSAFGARRRPAPGALPGEVAVVSAMAHPEGV